MSTDENELLRDFYNGNSRAFEIIFHQYKNQIYNFAYKLLGEKETAGDITQEVFMKLFKSQNNPAKINNLKSWLFILTRNLCLNKVRDSKKEIDLEFLDVEKLDESGTLMLKTLKLKRALLKLEPNLRDAIILREYQGFSYTEISEILNLSVSGVKSLLFRARVRLKEIFEKIN